MGLERALVVHVDTRVARLAPRDEIGYARRVTEAAAVEAGAAVVAAALLDEVGWGAWREVLEDFVFADPLEPDPAREVLGQRRGPAAAAAVGPFLHLAEEGGDLLRVRGRLWGIKFGRPTPATRPRPCDCVCCCGASTPSTRHCPHNFIRSMASRWRGGRR